MESLEGRTVVITGAASGMGRAFAEGFRADGADVVGCDIDEAGLAALGQQGIHTAVADVSDDAAVRECNTFQVIPNLSSSYSRKIIDRRNTANIYGAKCDRRVFT